MAMAGALAVPLSTANLVLTTCDRPHVLRFLISQFQSPNPKFRNLHFKTNGDFSSRRFRVYCETQRIMACPLNGAIPDIWRYSAEKFGDRVALVDPFHYPPTNMTYKQLEQQILDFGEGLRVIGLKPSEKLALFADNSCRWLVADQGMMATGAINVVRWSRSSVEELLQIYNHSESVALTVENPELFKCIGDLSVLKRIYDF